VTAVTRLPAATGPTLALPASPGGARPTSRRRSAILLGLLVVAALAALVARRDDEPAGPAGPPGRGSAARERRESPRAASADPARARARTPRPADAPPPPDRVVPPRHASALFAQHTWLVLAPAPPPPPPPPPPEPTAPPLPYTFLGSFNPEGERPVYFLARGDRMIDAHVGDRLDGVYQLESAAGGQLVFLYLPLNVRQRLAGVVK
jgi:hypothetical protein